jgi:S1-C subfamily serine protease
MNAFLLRLCAALMVVSSFAWAQVDGGTSDRTGREDSARAREEARKQREKAKEKRREEREAAKERMRAMREMAREARDLARQQRMFGLYPKLGVVVGGDRTGRQVGARVEEVMSGSPAQKAGIRQGDVLTAINGQPLAPSPDGGTDSSARAVAKLLAAVHKAKAGDKLKVEYWRGSEKRQAEVTLEEGSRSWASYRHSFVNERKRYGPYHVPISWLDVELVEVNRELGQYFGTDHGLLVVRASEAPDLKLKGGDVILRIGNEEPRTALDAVRVLRRSEAGKPLSLKILRHKKPQTVTVRVPPEND